MTRALGITVLVAGLVAGPMAAQDPLAPVRQALSGADPATAASRLADLLQEPPEGTNRSRLLARAADLFRDDGHTIAWLAALDAALARSPDDPLLLYTRGRTRLDLKLLEGARADLLRAQEQDPDAPAIGEALVEAAVLAFEHGRAATLARRIATPWAKATAEQEQHTVTTLERAQEIQWGALLAAALLLSGMVLASWRLTRRRPV